MTLQELVLVWNKLKQDVKLDAVFKDKGDEAHPEKSCGYEKYKSCVKTELGITQLSFGTFILKKRGQCKYWVMILHEDGVEVSIRQQLTTRQGIYKGKNSKSGLWLKTSVGERPNLFSVVRDLLLGGDQSENYILAGWNPEPICPCKN